MLLHVKKLLRMFVVLDVCRGKKRLCCYFKDQAFRFKNGNREQMDTFVQKTGGMYCCVQNLKCVDRKSWLTI